MKLINADCIEAMKEMPDNSVDSIVTDPPYELGFMGKSWDSTGIAFNVEVWQEALRVLKPGGHLIAFSGSRTYHRMAVAIEDAGFEIRDQIMWVYGSGFPKSHSIDKAIDKAAGAEREVVGADTKARSTSGNSALPTVGGDTIYLTWDLTAPATDEAKQWQGWGTALKPAHEPMVLARKPVIGTVATNVLTWGVGGLNIDGSRVSSSDNFEGIKGFSSMKLNARRNGESLEEWKVRCESGPEQQESLKKLQELGRWPANFIHDGSWEVLELFPDTGKSGVAVRRNGNNAKGLFWNIKIAEGSQDVGFNDSGSAARFFYCAKTSKRDRNEGLEDVMPKFRAGLVGADREGVELDDVSERFRTQPAANNHPTVKPTDLMRYLVKLVTPPNGIVLDPFMGSGSTGKGCVLEGFDFIGIEMNAEYLEIAKARIAYVQR